ncbi:MAG: hypothetical protein GWM81_02715 [Desulfobacterales bacterium]|jgi:Tfp pilus assembly protein PilO|nr:hypothetical protein [Desulfobacterales bacterium]
MKLGKREKYLVVGAGLAVGAFILLGLVVFPFVEKLDRLEQEALDEIVRLKSEYEQVKSGSNNMLATLGKRDKKFSLFAHLEKTAAASGVKEHIKYMKPSSSSGSGPYIESSVEMKLIGVSLEELTDYLYVVEDPERSVWIRRASIKAQKKPPRHLDVVLQVMTIGEGG